MKRVLSVQRIIIISVLIILVIGFANTVDTQSDEPEQDKNTITVSHDSGFYSTGFVLEISGENISEIIYTMDGSLPCYDSDSTFIYRNGIDIWCEEIECPYTIRFQAVFNDGTSSEILTRSYIVGDYVTERYEIPVLCVSAPDSVFFDADTGLLVSPEKHKHGSETEREVHVSLFQSDGTLSFSQHCGFRIHGAYNRGRDQASFRLYARSEYDEINKFENVIFNNQYDENNALISQLKRVIVRNSGNDQGYAFIRSELASRICLDAGFPDAQCSSPVAVYFNNVYYGPYWFVTNFDEWYFRDTYGDYDGTMQVLEGTMDNILYSENEDNAITRALIDEYNEKYAYYASCDLTQEDNWSSLNQFLDVENFLQYMAIHNYNCNTDSLKNNFKIYRYIAQDNNYKKNSVFDGKYRFLLYDLDYCFGFTDRGGGMTTSDRINSQESYDRFFANLMTRDDCKEYYIRYLLSLQNYYFSEDYVVPILEEMHGNRNSELEYAVANTTLFVDNYPSPDVTTPEDIRREIDRVVFFLKHRPYYVAKDLSALWGLSTYALRIENPDNIAISIDYAITNKDFFEGMYYKEVPVSISAQPNPQYSFEYWLINEEKIYSSSIEIDADLIKNNSLSITCICSERTDADLLITGICAKGDNDYIEITNIGTEGRYLSDYYLSDNDMWNYSPLPMYELLPGESIIIYCDNYLEFDSLGKPYVNFSLKDGETLTLTRKDQTTIQQISIPSLGFGDSLYMLDMDANKFYEKVKRDN